MKHYKSAEFLSNLNVKQPLHKRSPLLTTFWRRLCMYPRLGSSRPVTSLGHQGWRRVLWEGPKFFKLDPIVFNYAQHIFPGGGGEKFCFFGYGPGKLWSIAWSRGLQTTACAPNPAREANSSGQRRHISKMNTWHIYDTFVDLVECNISQNDHIT